MTIKKYGNRTGQNSDYVFDILQPGQYPETQQMAVKNFTRFINQHLKKLCKVIDLPSDISTYWARQSFAINTVRKRSSLVPLSVCLGHGDLKTTQNYLDGFDDKSKKNLAKSLMEFEI